MDQTQRVVFGMDPHKRSVTIEVLAGDETILGKGRFATDRHGYAEMLAYCRQWPNRRAAATRSVYCETHLLEGCAGAPRIANGRA